MKKILIVLATVALLSSGCNKDFLDRNPLDQLSTSSFWKSQSDLDQALTACYAKLKDGTYSTHLPIWDNITDNSYGQHTNDFYNTKEIVTGNINSSNGGFEGTYNSAYSGIARANIFLENLKSATISGLSDATKKTYEAEARMIRAHYYSYLYRLYGSVPLVDKPVDLETMNMAKSSAADINKFMMDDIDFSIANLSAKTYQESGGHWTQGAAKAFKARMLLYDAYDDSGNAIAQKMTDVKALLSSITGYTIGGVDFSDNFLSHKQENCPEIMMSVKRLAPNDWTEADMVYGDWVAVSPLSNFISEFEFKDGTPGTIIPYIGNGLIDVTSFTNADLALRDSRLAKTVFIDKYFVNGVSYKPSNGRPTGAGLAKFLSTNVNLIPYDYATQSEQDWVLMRYADVLLMLAEAENEINGATATAYNAINSVRARSGMPDLVAGLTKDQMRAKIRHERRIELAFEGQRYFDLKRWKIAKQVLNAVVDGKLIYKFEDKHYLWPLPQGEIDKSNGILIQNSDY